MSLSACPTLELALRVCPRHATSANFTVSALPALCQRKVGFATPVADRGSLDEMETWVSIPGRASAKAELEAETASERHFQERLPPGRCSCPTRQPARRAAARRRRRRPRDGRECGRRGTS